MYVKGVGPARAAMLEAKGLKVVEDLLTYAPFRYEDRSNVKTIAELAPGEMATVLAEGGSAPRQCRTVPSHFHRRFPRTRFRQMVPRGVPGRRAHSRRESGFIRKGG